MRTFVCLAIMFLLAHFNVKIGLLGILLIFAFLLAFFQDVKELASKK